MLYNFLDKVLCHFFLAAKQSMYLQLRESHKIYCIAFQKRKTEIISMQVSWSLWKDIWGRFIDFAFWQNTLCLHRALWIRTANFSVYVEGGWYLKVTEIWTYLKCPSSTINKDWLRGKRQKKAWQQKYIFGPRVLHFQSVLWAFANSIHCKALYKIHTFLSN